MTLSDAEKSPKCVIPNLKKPAEYIIDTKKPGPHKFIKINAAQMNALNAGEIPGFENHHISANTATDRIEISIEPPSVQRQEALLRQKVKTRVKSNSENNDAVTVDRTIPASQKIPDDSLQSNRPTIFAGHKLNVNDDVMGIHDKIFAVVEKSLLFSRNAGKSSEVSGDPSSSGAKRDLNVPREVDCAEEIAFKGEAENCQADSTSKSLSKPEDLMRPSAVDVASEETTMGIDHQAPPKPNEDENRASLVLKQAKVNKPFPELNTATSNCLTEKETEVFDLTNDDDPPEEFGKIQTESENKNALNVDASEKKDCIEDQNKKVLSSKTLNCEQMEVESAFESNRVSDKQEVLGHKESHAVHQIPGNDKPREGSEIISSCKSEETLHVSDDDELISEMVFYLNLTLLFYICSH